jgi:hypothetical protein
MEGGTYRPCNIGRGLIGITWVYVRIFLIRKLVHLGERLEERPTLMIAYFGRKCEVGFGVVRWSGFRVARL